MVIYAAAGTDQEMPQAVLIAEDHVSAPALAVVFPNPAPFVLKAGDVNTLAQSDGFTILRQHLAERCVFDLCDRHSPGHLGHGSNWTLVRDILHALVVPIVELYDKARGIAQAATHAEKPEDLEYVYKGEARGAFAWLQCFLEKERDWCYTHGCPACVGEHALDSEFTIRLLHAACLLSDVHYPSSLEGPTLPSFMFFLHSLELALQNDPLWGAPFFEMLKPKAVSTRNGVADLIHQCLELEAILSAPPSPTEPSSLEMLGLPSPALGPLGGPGMRVKRSKIAKWQMKLAVEEEMWMEEVRQRCGNPLLPPASEVLQTTQSLDAVLKEPDAAAVVTVTVTEVVATE